MSNDLTPQDGMNPELEEVEETVEETTETQVGEEQEETVPKSQFAQVLARAKKAEDEARKLRESKPTTNSVSMEDIEVKILKSQGVDDELLNEMKALAKVRGKSVLEIQNDPILVAMKEQKEREVAAQKAKLPASRGSSTVKKEKEINSPGLSDEEHKALWREQNNK